MERDLRLDFFRGLALFCIFLDHLPNNILASFTLQSVMFADAAEVFILISGYTAGMVYGRAMERQGFLAAGFAYTTGCGSSTSPTYFCSWYSWQWWPTPRVPSTNRSYSEEFGATNFLERAGPGAGPGIDAPVPARLHGHLAALHCAAGGSPPRASRVPVLAGSGALPRSRSGWRCSSTIESRCRRIPGRIGYGS